MNKGAHLKVQGVHGASQLFLPYHVLEEVKSTPKIELQSKSTFEVGHYFCLPTLKSGSIIYFTDMHWNFSPCPTMHSHYLGPLGIINLLFFDFRWSGPKSRKKLSSFSATIDWKFI